MEVYVNLEPSHSLLVLAGTSPALPLASPGQSRDSLS
jgi:hypothetical protein